MDPDEVQGRAALEADLARRIRDAVVTEVPRRRVRTWLITGMTVLVLAGLLVVLVR